MTRNFMVLFFSLVFPRNGSDYVNKMKEVKMVLLR